MPVAGEINRGFVTRAPKIKAPPEAQDQSGGAVRPKGRSAWTKGAIRGDDDGACRVRIGGEIRFRGSDRDREGAVEGASHGIAPQTGPDG